jgi:hypothetical protein
MSHQEILGKPVFHHCIGRCPFVDSGAFQRTVRLDVHHRQSVVQVIGTVLKASLSR